MAADKLRFVELMAMNRRKEVDRMENPLKILLGAVLNKNNAGDPFHFTADMEHVEMDSNAWGEAVAAGLVDEEDGGGWRITDAGRARLAEFGG